MNKDALAADLVALAAVKPSDKTTSKAARLRAVLPEVEMALEAGRTQAEVLARLNAHGLDMTLAVFTKTLNRLRGGSGRKVRAGTKTAAPAAGPAQLATPARNLSPPGRKWSDPPPEPDDLDQLIKHGKQKE